MIYRVSLHDLTGHCGSILLAIIATKYSKFYCCAFITADLTDNLRQILSRNILAIYFVQDVIYLKSGLFCT